jgi:hypothetical protein
VSKETSEVSVYAPFEWRVVGRSAQKLYPITVASIAMSAS